jgi:signal transduction histidine kinase
LLERQKAEEKLKNQYTKLQKTLKDLSNTKEQLYHSEKMASLGQMAAGLAHEINNPLAFIMGNFTHLDEYVDSMTGLLKHHAEFMDVLDHNNTEMVSRMKTDISNMQEGLDLNFIFEDVRCLVNESKEGLVRVKDIINNLKQFSRIDNEAIESVDVHQGIESTLKMLKYQLKYGIEVTKNYGDLPELQCNLGLLNQVIMNILHNAIQALDSKGKIEITTSLNAEQKIEIKIRDNGSGMSEDTQKKIFEPFFTTKPVGVGTGLGLSVCYSIIKNMKGNIQVKSELGQFTEFTIQI